MQKINFENLPSTNTPLNASNLNQVQTNVDNAKLEKTVVVTATSQNLDSYRTEGRYYFDASNPPTNRPAGTNGELEVITNTAGFCKQFWYRHGTADTNDYETYVRTSTDGSNWSSWQRYIVAVDYYYKANDKYIAGASIPVSYLGYITGDAKDIRFTIYTPKSLKNISTITVNKMKLNIRHPGGGYVGSSDYDFKNLVSEKIKINDNTIDIGIHKDTNWGITNNVPLSVQPTEMELQFS